MKVDLMELERKTFWQSSLQDFKSGGRRVSGEKRASSVGLPVITVITAVYNGEDFLEETIKSVLAQDYPALEYIIIDGGSTDSTVDILKKYENSIDYWISEKDQGISDAFNKGIILSSGTYLNFQGDGDGFTYKSALKDVIANELVRNEPMLISSRIRRINLIGETIFESKTPVLFTKYSLLFRMALPHQGLLTHVKFFQKYGLFDVKNTFCMDYEHLLRAYKSFPEVMFSNIILANWRADGIGEGKIDKIFKEYDSIKRKNKVASGLALDAINKWAFFKFKLKSLVNKL